MRPGSSFREAAGEGLAVIHFRKVLIDSKEEVGSPCFPPRSLVAALAVTGHREEGNEEIRVAVKEEEIKASSFPSSASGPSV